MARPTCRTRWSRALPKAASVRCRSRDRRASVGWNRRSSAHMNSPTINCLVDLYRHGETRYRKTLSGPPCPSGVRSDTHGRTSSPPSTVPTLPTLSDPVTTMEDLPPSPSLPTASSGDGALVSTTMRAPAGVSPATKVTRSRPGPRPGPRVSTENVGPGATTLLDPHLFFSRGTSTVSRGRGKDPSSQVGSSVRRPTPPWDGWSGWRV